MDQLNHPFALLNWVERPAFCVTGEQIAAVNEAATHYLLSVGMPVSPLLGDHIEAYRKLTEGCLHVTLSINGIPCNASITHMDGFDLFLIEQSNASLQALALAAQHLRSPLASVMAASDQLFSQLDQDEAVTQANQINRGLYQILRIVSNMSDAATYQASAQIPMEMMNFTAAVQEFVEKARGLTETTGISIHFSDPKESILGLANPEQIERAFYNLLSNAIKFTGEGETIEVRLIKSSNQLSFIIQNPGTTDRAGDIFTAYHRTAGLEDSRKGIGLGLTFVRAVAVCHGGTVLVDHPQGTHTRVTMTIPLQKDNSATLRSPVLRIGDYAGGRDKGLLELSEVLNSSAYNKIN